MPRTRWALFLLAVPALLALLLCPGVGRISDGEAWVYSANNVKQISVALRGYHEIYRHLPPAVVKDKNGKPLYSWRVAILPFVECNDLYKQFHLDEPWDSPHNLELLKENPRVYRHPRGNVEESDKTPYVVLVGPGTAFEKDGLTLDDFTNGLDKTILIVES